MRVFLGVLVLVAGLVGLSIWGARNQAVEVQQKIADAARAIVAQSVQPMQLRVSGRDITLSGTADTAEERDRLVAALDAVAGRRVVNADTVTVLPDIARYETAIAKGADGSLAVTGYAPTPAARAELAEALPAATSLPLGHGAPADWQAALSAGAAALAPLQTGSFALTGSTLTLTGTAPTPVEEDAARQALAGLSGFETVVAMDVTDPGLVDLTLHFDASDGFRAEGIAPEALGRAGLSAALGTTSLDGNLTTTYAEAPDLPKTLEGLRGMIGQLETAKIHADNSGVTVDATALPGLDPETVKKGLAAVLGSSEGLRITAAPAPADGAERINAATGKVQFAAGGVWMNRPDITVSKPACTKAASDAIAAAPIRFVTGSAQLDPASLAAVNDIAGIITLCTARPDLRVVIGGHTDAQGDDNANYILSIDRAKAVRKALIDRGIAPGKLVAIGYGETEPVASNDTAEGRAKNRRTTFTWP